VAVSGAAMAQVTLSGAVATEYSRTTTADATLNNGDAGGTNFALSATEDLGGGLKASVFMQQRFNSVTGENINTTILTAGDRGLQNVHVELSGSFGAVRIGRFLTNTNGAYDAFGQYGHTTYAKSGAVGGRSDRTVQFSSPNISGFTFSVASTNTTGTGSEYTHMNAEYAMGPVSVAVSSQKAAAVAGVTAVKAQNINASYDLGVAKIMVQNGKSTSALAVDTTNTTVGARVPMGAMTFKVSARSGDAANQTAVGVDYALSKRTGLYADMMNETAAVNSAFRLGIKHSF